MGERYLDVVLQKPDVDLFKELFRLYPLAEVDDYFKGGVWQRELLKMDIQAIFAHREEAGAPEAPPLDEITLPPLPNQPTPNATISLMPLEVKLPNGDGETQVVLKPQAAVNGTVVPPKAKAMPPQLAASIPKRPEGQVVPPPAQTAAATQPAVAATPTPAPAGPTVAPRVEWPLVQEVRPFQFDPEYAGCGQIKVRTRQASTNRGDGL
ncbi:Comt, partial [Symbiodinium necroappetens]